MADFIPNFWRAMTEQDTGRRVPKRHRLGLGRMESDVMLQNMDVMALREIRVSFEAYSLVLQDYGAPFPEKEIPGVIHRAREDIAQLVAGDIAREILSVVRDLTATGDLDYRDPRIRCLLGIVAGIRDGRGVMPEPEEIANAD